MTKIIFLAVILVAVLGDPIPDEPVPEPPGVFDCPPDDNCLTTGCLYQNNDDCSQFFQCDLSRRAFRKQCPEGLQFNERVRVCAYPPSPTCGGLVEEPEEEAIPTTVEPTTERPSTARPTPTEAPTARPPQDGEFECPAGDNCLNTGCLYQNHNNCSEFYQCDLSGRVFVKQCPGALEFNENNRVCDYPPSPTCRRTSPEVPEETTTTEATTTEAETTEAETTTTEATTTEAETTTAEAETTTTEEPAPEEPGAFTCPPDDDCLTTGCLYQNYDDCSQFWQCDLSRRAFRKQCPAGLQFSERARVCVWPPSPTCNRNQQ